MILMILDATKRAEQRALLEAELEAVGIRLNKQPPSVFAMCILHYNMLNQKQEYLLEAQEGRWHEDHLPNTS